MKIHVENEIDNSKQTVLLKNGTVLDLLTKLNINPETVLVIRNSNVLTEDIKLNDNDTIEILSVVSGG